MTTYGSTRGPGKSELRRFLEMGLTQQQIVDAWERVSNVRVSRSTIAMAIRRYGLESVKPRPRYEDTLPWVVSEEHRMHNDARMLRLEGRRRKGGKLTESQARWLTQWRAALDEADAVVHYDRQTAEGFFWVKRGPGEGVIRTPPPPGGGDGAQSC